MDNARLLTAREAANYLHVSLSTLWRLERQGLLIPFRTPGGHRRYSPAMLQGALDRSRLTLSLRQFRSSSWGLGRKPGLKSRAQRPKSG
jgi:excisionase family DNA binding protein